VTSSPACAAVERAPSSRNFISSLLLLPLLRALLRREHDQVAVLLIPSCAPT
jgi:hypothetical protein